MKIYGARAFVLGALLLLLTGAGPRQKSWTLLFYVAGDESEIDRYSRLPIRKLEQVGSSSGRWIIVQSDLHRNVHGGPAEDEATRRYVIEKHPGPIDVNDYKTLQVNSPVVWESKGEQNSAATETLSAFLRWGKAQYPADHYALFVLGHGWSWRGVPEDDNPGFKIPQPPNGTRLEMWIQPLQDFGRALRENFSHEPLDLLVMDSCSMGVLEFLFELRGNVRQVLASPDEVPFYSFDYERTLGLARARSGEELGKLLLSHLLESFSRTGTQAPLEGDYSALSLALWDLERFEPFWAEWRALLQALTPSHFAQLFGGETRAAYLDLEENGDLYELLEVLSEHAAEPSVRRRAHQIKRVLWGDHAVRMPEETPFAVPASVHDKLSVRVQGDELLDPKTALQKAQQIFGWLNPALSSWSQKWQVIRGRDGQLTIEGQFIVPAGVGPVIQLNPWIAGATWAELTTRTRGRAAKVWRKELPASYFVSQTSGAAALRALGHTAGASRSRGLSVFFADSVPESEPQNHHLSENGRWLAGADYYRSLAFDRAFQWSRLILGR